MQREEYLWQCYQLWEHIRVRRPDRTRETYWLRFIGKVANEGERPDNY